ncbi:MAG TPA: SPOR domain-containing protein [Candidatus Limnocylindrales bacterium]|jgi:cell division septation protein DedD|nr:SPOR domain-containing protein [Candidatus Limnocylindrales bacterium]
MDLGHGKAVLRDEDLDSPKHDTEITLSTGKLLGIFFGLVIVCSVFFTMGYLLGKSTAAGSHTQIVGAITTGGTPAGKPSAGNRPPESPAPAPAQPPVSQDNPQTPASTAANSGASSTAPTEIKANPAGTYTVQVAAVSKREDADILVSALSKKQYPVFVANSATDALFHVQVGPFTDPKDAEAMRVRLSGDGYNAIVKH